MTVNDLIRPLVAIWLSLSSQLSSINTYEEEELTYIHTKEGPELLYLKIARMYRILRLADYTSLLVCRDFSERSGFDCKNIIENIFLCYFVNCLPSGCLEK